MTTQESNLDEYETQLLAVNEALKHADTDQREDLLDLKNTLEEVILLLKGSESNKSEILSNTDTTTTDKTDIDDEFAKFQKEMSLLGGSISDDYESKEPSAPNDNSTDESDDEEENDNPSDVDELIQVVSSFEGKKCRAPFSQPWGEKEFHNAVIISTDFDPNAVGSLDDVEVKVMFCHPTCNEMKPCPFFLSGHCKFPDDQCRFSHGYKVKFNELQEFTLPDYSKVTVDSRCLVQSSDGLWHRATVEKCLEEQKYLIKYDRSKKTDTLDAELIIPLDEKEEEEEELLTEEYYKQFMETNPSDNKNLKSPNDIILRPDSVIQWERHNRGIASKLMEKMGHIWGQGLGKNSDGRLDPIEAVILPSGKSLDKCIEMRETCDVKGPVSLEIRLALEQDQEEQRAKKIKVVHHNKKHNVFDFLNNTIGKVKKQGENSIDLQKPGNSETKSKSPKDLNIQVFSIGEDIRKAKREISHLHKALARNKERNDVIKAQVEKKIEAQSNLLRNLQAKERQLNREITSQSNHKKLTIF